MVLSVSIPFWQNNLCEFIKTLVWYCFLSPFSRTLSPLSQPKIYNLLLANLLGKCVRKEEVGFFYARSFSFCSLGEVQCKNVLARVVVTPLWSGRVLSNFPKPFLSYIEYILKGASPLRVAVNLAARACSTKTKGSGKGLVLKVRK